MEEESEEWVVLLATKVPFRVASRRCRRVLATSCSRRAASSFLLNTAGSNGWHLLLGLVFSVRMTGAICAPMC